MGKTEHTRLMEQEESPRKEKIARAVFRVRSGSGTTRPSHTSVEKHGAGLCYILSFIPAGLFITIFVLLLLPAQPKPIAFYLSFVCSLTITSCLVLLFAKLTTEDEDQFHVHLEVFPLLCIFASGIVISNLTDAIGQFNGGEIPKFLSYIGLTMETLLQTAIFILSFSFKTVKITSLPFNIIGILVIPMITWNVGWLILDVSSCDHLPSDMSIPLRNFLTASYIGFRSLAVRNWLQIGLYQWVNENENFVDQNDIGSSNYFGEWVNHSKQFLFGLVITICVESIIMAWDIAGVGRNGLSLMSMADHVTVALLVFLLWFLWHAGDRDYTYTPSHSMWWILGYYVINVVGTFVGVILQVQDQFSTCSNSSWYPRIANFSFLAELLCQATFLIYHLKRGGATFTRISWLRFIAPVLIIFNLRSCLMDIFSPWDGGACGSAQRRAVLQAIFVDFRLQTTLSWIFFFSRIQEDAARAQAATHSASADDTLRKRNVTARECSNDDADVQSTLPRGWLTDNALVLALERLKQRHPKPFASVLVVKPAEVELAKNSNEIPLLLNDNIREVFFPTNVGNNHWILLQLTRGDGISMQVYDSLPGRDSIEVAHEMTRKTLETLGKANEAHCKQWLAAMKVIQIKDVPSPSQPNGYDCGVIVFERIRHCLGLIMTVPVKQADLDAARKSIHLLLCDRHEEKPSSGA